MKPLYRSMLIILIILVNLLTVTDTAWSQETIAEELPTRKTDKRVKENIKKNNPSKSEVSRIYVTDGSKLLYGNPCAIEATQAMGFEYAIEHRENAILASFYSREGHFGSSPLING